MTQSPFEDVASRVQISVHARVASLALEDRLAFAVLLSAIPALTARLRRVRGVDEYETILSSQPGLVREFADDPGGSVHVSLTDRYAGTRPACLGLASP